MRLCMCVGSRNSARPRHGRRRLAAMNPACLEGKLTDFAESAPALRALPNCSEKLRTNRGQRSAPGMILVQVRHHLGTVAHAKRETVFACEERAELVARAEIEQDGLGQALASAEHVAERESATGGKTLKSFSDARPSHECRSWSRPPRRSRRRRKAAAISSWPVTPCSPQDEAHLPAPLPM